MLRRTALFSIRIECRLWHDTAMTIADALSSSGIERIDCELLLAHAIAKPRTWVLSHPEYELKKDECDLFSNNMTRRKGNEPVAYITGENKFFGRPFFVDRSVLIPRPATEGLVDVAIDMIATQDARTIDVDADIVAWGKWLKEHRQVESIVDVGTGSGCVAITLAIECPNLRVIATDVSEDALTIARKNAKRHGVGDRIIFKKGSLLDPVRDHMEPFLLVSNPPYIPEETELMKDVVDFEPREALFAGEDGLSILQPLLLAAVNHRFCLGILIECTNDQYVSLDDLLQKK